MANLLKPGSCRNQILIWTSLGILLFFLLTEHRAHLFGALPWLLLAGCVLLHRFMHGPHGGAEDHQQGADRE